MVTIYYAEIALHGEKAGKRKCGKRRVRREKFWQTLNEFNRHKDGKLKTKQDIMDELAKERAEWMKLPITCAACESLK